MNNFPFEVLKCVDECNQKECSGVCKLWHKIFWPLLFRVVYFESDEQIDMYLKVEDFKTGKPRFRLVLEN